MEILGIGPSELIFIIIIALIVLGPKDMQKAGRTIGKWLRDIVTSDSWKIFQQTSREVRNLPTRLMREANEELQKLDAEINAPDSARARYGSWDTSPGSRSNLSATSASVPATPSQPPTSQASADDSENIIAPPSPTESTEPPPETNA